MKHGRFLSLRVVVATPSMRETAVPLTAIRYMGECSIYNLICIEIRLKLKVRHERGKEFHVGGIP